MPETAEVKSKNVITKLRRPRTLTCCCCDSDTKGRQWWNRDEGYGLCNDCIVANGVKDVLMGSVAQSFGVRGIHWDIQPVGFPQHEVDTIMLVQPVMTVKRMIRALQELPPDAELVSGDAPFGLQPMGFVIEHYENLNRVVLTCPTNQELINGAKDA